MKDFANRKKTKIRNNKNKQAFGSKRSNDNSISKNTIVYLLSLAFFLLLYHSFILKPKSLQ